MRCTVKAAAALGLLLFAQAAHAAPLDHKAVEQWADAYFKTGLAKTGLPGAVIAVVQDGKPVLLKAYGVADAARRDPVDVDRMLFRVGSITKVFTAVVALQLAEEGKLDLNRDVNAYLKHFQVPRTYARPITADNLLAHAGGFAEDRRGRYGYDALRVTADPPPLSSGGLSRLLAPRVREPGLFSSYDNHGFGLLALVEEAVDGKSFRALMHDRIFAPLGMAHSTTGVPTARERDAAMGHEVLADGRAVPTGYDRRLELDQGSGDVTVTAPDMARFMIALLNGGVLDGKRVLSPAGFRELTDFDARRLHPALPGLGRAIVESDIAGHRAWRHDGGLEGYGATMVLYPKSRIGVFIALNGRNANPVAEERLSGLTDAFAQLSERPKALPVLLYFFPVHDDFSKRFVAGDPVPKVRPNGPLLNRDALKALEGVYGGDPAQATYFAGKLINVALGGRNVSVLPDNRLKIGRTAYTQVARGLFADKDGDRVAFAVTPAGVFMGDSFLTAQRRSPWYADPMVTLLPLIALPLLMLGGLAFLRARDRRLTLAGLVYAAGGLVLLIALWLEAQYGNQFYENDLWLVLLAWRVPVNLVALVFAALPIWLGMLRWKGGIEAGRAARIFAVVLCIAGVIEIQLLAYWGVLGRFVS